MSLLSIVLNLLFAFLAFFVVRWIGGAVTPEGQDRDKIVTVVAVIVAILVFFANLAVRITV